VQPVEPHLEAGVEPPRLGHLVGHGLTEPGRIDRQLHHHRLPARPGGVQRTHDLGRVGQRRLVDHHHGGVGPRHGHLAAGVDDDTSTQHPRSGHDRHHGTPG
jgi:hypothetical protein